MSAPFRRRPDAALVLEDGRVFLGHGCGRPGTAVGELVFNTAMTGYQEILTDPSYAAQIVTFTFPHIGIVGTNREDPEASTPHVRGMVCRAAIGEPSNWRAAASLAEWLDAHGLFAVTGIDTRRLTRILREEGFKNAAIAYDPAGELDLDGLARLAREWPGIVGMDLVDEVSCTQRYDWHEGLWRWPDGHGGGPGDGPRVVVVDYGVKRNILRGLVDAGFRVTVVPGRTPASEILALAPDGVLLSNGPGDPAATGRWAVPQIRALLEAGVPLFGICLGHQMLGLALGARTVKMPFGHHGANHPVRELATGRVLVTSQNHGFAIADEGLPDEVEVTHRSLFDGTIQGIRVRGRPAFSVQFHPEASPGPHDAQGLFRHFRTLIEASGS